MNAIVNILNQQVTSVGGNPLTLSDILTTVGLVLAFYFLARITTRGARNFLQQRTRISATALRLSLQMFSGFMLLAGVYVSLSALGLDLSVFLIPLGALSIGLGLGLQSLAGNFVSGLVLLTERTVREGDIIEVDGIMGTVQETGLRATVLKTFGNTEAVLPNSVLTSQRLDNWTRSDRILRVESFVSVAYGTEVEPVHQTLMERIRSHPAVLDEPEPNTFLVELGDSALRFRILYWIDDPSQRLSSLSEILQGIHEDFAEQGIAIPFPQLDVNLHNRLASSYLSTGDQGPSPQEHAGRDTVGNTTNKEDTNCTATDEGREV
ncbi:MAG: mechanosensitive ion channel [Caldilineaceae bacterium SB0662_bin_9]|uniref:Mechanosensitive ion channel n=1 Tax=Caldilineaceae bacterium SB0662_bin_9 TaxID=2605258 RepID=A0A6B1DT09_9CHLR|nr:mechanosensitive ion channel [Caldilineaceae bacterium SB0662_bin_9]